jgi:DNA invertase Pin-like site-specific DNA recombinase
MDLRPALAMLDQGHGLKTTAKALGVSRATLRRRLEEGGVRPRPERLRSRRAARPHSGVQRPGGKRVF